jgi:hypothetical protein
VGPIFHPAVVNGGRVESEPLQTLPRHGLDVPDIAFGAQTTLAYAETNTDTSGTLTVSDGRHAGGIALLVNYMAGSLVAVADGDAQLRLRSSAHNGQPVAPGRRQLGWGVAEPHKPYIAHCVVSPAAGPVKKWRRI